MENILTILYPIVCSVNPLYAGDDFADIVAVEVSSGLDLFRSYARRGT